MAVAGSSEKRPQWCPPGTSRHITPTRRPSSHSSSDSSSKRPSSSSSSRNSPSPTTPSSLGPPLKLRRKSSNPPSNSHISRPQESSAACRDGPGSQDSSPDVRDKFNEPDLQLSQGTQSLSTLFRLPKDLFYIRESGQAYELGFSSAQDILTLASRLDEEIQVRYRVQDELAKLTEQLKKVTEDRNEAQSRANDLEQRLESALKVKAASEQLGAASTLPDVRPTPANPGEFTPENYIWAKQQWDRVAEDNLKMDNCLHIASAEKKQLETEIIRLSREVETYQKRNMRPMNDAAQQTEDEPPWIAIVATQTDFIDQISQQNTENKPLESDQLTVPPQQPRIVMTDAAVQVAEQHDEDTEMRSALEQPQNEYGPSEELESHVSDTNPEEAQTRNEDPGVEVQDAEVEMGGITTGQDPAAPQEIETSVIPATRPETSEAEEILRITVPRPLINLNRDSRTSSDDARRRRDSRRRKRRQQRRLEPEEERARRRQQRRLERVRESQRTRDHHGRSPKVYRQKPPGWRRYLNRRRTWMDFFPFSYMFSLQ
ncbi:hypothetical protein FGADI_1659 [Fusarium gaditjirri]|uniref:Uncharacterized protein n=1 Tax=Fusarium gaditjirri TaxID=282569 RepID=A0A8H4TK88_9HYPO|nr:hypothetical protein FGADI_1659 [Fusarium gaditjirri]